jgi:hypothetical protein
MKVVTYATHSEGSFEELTHNKFGVEVKVLGMGEKWQGFVHRVKKYREYLDTLDDNEVVVFVDGFDSHILKPLRGLEDIFKSFNCDILVSKNVTIQPHYIIHKMFGTCKDNTTANAGLLMGYARHLKHLQDSIINGKTVDDQKNLNEVCKQFPNLMIDTDCVIFKNITPNEKIEKLYKSGAFFGQTPGAFTFSRRIRAVKEYAPFFIPEIILFLLILYFLYLHFKI